MSRLLLAKSHEFCTHVLLNLHMYTDVYQSLLTDYIEMDISDEELCILKIKYPLLGVTNLKSGKMTYILYSFI